MIYKTFRVDVKAVNEETGEVDMLIPMSTASIDRDGESIDPMGWKKSLPAFKKRPVLLSSHDYHDLRKQIGEFTTIRVNADGLFAKPKYYINEGNEEADWAFKLASKGVAAYSVGFIPTKWVEGDGEKEPRRTYTEQELLEISHVVVPSNRDAIQSVRSKSVDPIVNEILDEVLEDDELIDKVKKPKEVSQEEIKDEIDYLTLMIDEVGLNDESEESLRELMKRLPGGDIPVGIVKLEIKDMPEVKEVLNQAQQIIDDDRLKLIIEQTVKNVIKEIK
jgi:HK97 family phage prohead protease